MNKLFLVSSAIALAVGMQAPAFAAEALNSTAMKGTVVGAIAGNNLDVKEQSLSDLSVKDSAQSKTSAANLTNSVKSQVANGMNAYSGTPVELGQNNDIVQYQTAASGSAIEDLSHSGHAVVTKKDDKPDHGMPGKDDGKSYETAGYDKGGDMGQGGYDDKDHGDKGGQDKPAPAPVMEGVTKLKSASSRYIAGQDVKLVIGNQAKLSLSGSAQSEAKVANLTNAVESQVASGLNVASFSAATDGYDATGYKGGHGQPQQPAALPNVWQNNTIRQVQ